MKMIFYYKKNILVLENKKIFFFGDHIFLGGQGFPSLPRF